MIGELILYSRSGCHLCEQMAAELQPLAQEHGCPVRVIDVDTDPELATRYGLKVPVLVAGGREICHYTLDREALLQCLEQG